MFRLDESNMGLRKHTGSDLITENTIKYSLHPRFRKNTKLQSAVWVVTFVPEKVEFMSCDV